MIKFVLQPAKTFSASWKLIFELFFCKKIPLSRRVGHVMGGWIMVQWIMDQRCMYVTPIRLDLLLNTNQISCYKGKWYVRRSHPDTVENGHIYSSVKEEEVFIYWVYLDIFCRYVRLRILWAGLIVFSNWIISQRKRNIVFGIKLRARDEGRAFPII